MTCTDTRSLNFPALPLVNGIDKGPKEVSFTESSDKSFSCLVSVFFSVKETRLADQESVGHQSEYMHQKMLVLFLVAWTADAVHPPPHNVSKQQMESNKGFGSSVIFPLSGNVYPQGYYNATINVGQPPKPYFLDIDTGSDLTWLQCDLPCRKCTLAPHSLYKPKGNPIACQDPICSSLQGQGDHGCQEPQDQCDYQVDYAEDSLSLGVLVKDSFSLELKNGSTVAPQVAFGCGYHQEVLDPAHAPFTDGVLGLGVGRSSILYQLRDMGVIRNVVGHCLSGRGGGFLFFGEYSLPDEGIVWKPMPTRSPHYLLGAADLQYGGRATNIKGLPIVFDSGSTYTYFNSQAYNALVSLIEGELNGKQMKDAAEDKSLPVCWKGPKPFNSIHDAVSYFKPLALSFTNAKNVKLQLPPESYLIVTNHGNVCLGILNGSDIGLGNTNLIGDISLQDKLVIYDNERWRIGWAPADCDKLQNLDLVDPAKGSAWVPTSLYICFLCFVSVFWFLSH